MPETPSELKDAIAIACRWVTRRGWPYGPGIINSVDAILESIDAAGYVIVSKDDYDKLEGAFVLHQIRAGNVTERPLTAAEGEQELIWAGGPHGRRVLIPKATLDEALSAARHRESLDGSD